MFPTKYPACYVFVSSTRPAQRTNGHKHMDSNDRTRKAIDDDDDDDWCFTATFVHNVG